MAMRAPRAAKAEVVAIAGVKPLTNTDGFGGDPPDDGVLRGGDRKRDADTGDVNGTTSWL